MENKFLIFNFPIKIGNWKLKILYHFSIFNFELKIEMCKYVLFHFNFKLKIEWHFWSPKVPFNVHFKIGTEKDIFAHFSFYFKIENWKIIFFFNFQLPILLKNWKFKFHFSYFNCRIYLRNCTSREIVIGFVLISLAEAMWCLKEKEKILLQLTLERERDLEEVMRSNVASNTPYYACI